ncbi:MAG: RsmE family RNA methyltransferase, partial [Chitinophagaceae bacterium]
IPLLCERTETEKFRLERLSGIMVSAMLQSQQCWLPLLSAPLHFQHLAVQARSGGKYIAHCADSEKDQLQNRIDKSAVSQLILVGPEGDFTEQEISTALSNNYLPVSLGNTRLRTETAGLTAVVILTTA